VFCSKTIRVHPRKSAVCLGFVFSDRTIAVISSGKKQAANAHEEHNLSFDSCSFAQIRGPETYFVL
jgi:hypothetical protein